VISPHPLDRLIEREAFGEMVALLTPEELVVAALRLEGLSDVQIAALLDIDRSAVSHRMHKARERIVAEIPELAGILRDRQQPRQKPPDGGTPSLEHGWICRWVEEDPLPEIARALTVSQVAQRYGVETATVRRWIRRGRFPHAYRAQGRRGDYRIPEGDLAIGDGAQRRQSRRSRAKARTS
jgi:excisionase family DNA binding protein